MIGQRRECMYRCIVRARNKPRRSISQLIATRYRFVRRRLTPQPTNSRTDLWVPSTAVVAQPIAYEERTHPDNRNYQDLVRTRDS